MKFADVKITSETITRTREHFADLGRQCIADAKAGTFYVNNLDRYVAWQEKCIATALAGGSDHTFTFMQRAHWLQTGESIPLLAPPK